MLHALALIAATVSTAALLIVVFLTVFVLSLALRAKRTPGSRPDTRDLDTSMVGAPRANSLRTRSAPGPGAGTDRLA